MGLGFRVYGNCQKVFGLLALWDLGFGLWGEEGGGVWGLGVWSLAFGVEGP